MDTYTRMVDCPEIQKFAPEQTSLAVWIPRQEDWQNILFREHYAPAIPTIKKTNAATIVMFQEHVDYMRGWSVYQPCEAWARLFMKTNNGPRKGGCDGLLAGKR